MQKLFGTYRVLAIIVGVLLTVLVFVAMPMKYFGDPGTSLQTTGETLVTIIGIAHGWIYMGYLVAAFLLARRSNWPWGFTLLMLAAGLLPIVIFFVERQVAHRARAEHPELA